MLTVYYEENKDFNSKYQ